jgi:predicted ATP-grasp superfamily ATP-dependent carboligase
MPEPANLLIFGASTRAAAFSALRAGLHPWCADLFADADLQARCPVTQVPAAGYPQQFLELARTDVFGPWMYTGGLENHPDLVHSIARHRTLLGNDQQDTNEPWHPVYQLRRHLSSPLRAKALGRARSPEFVVSVLSGANLPYAALFDEFPDELPSDGRWLVKPRNGAGGRGIHVWDERSPPPRLREPVYLQEYIEGQPCAAIYVGDGSRAQLLGVSQQLVGEAHLHAKPFRYCGSIGPLPLEPAQQATFERIGNALAAGCGLCGLFGVDCILADGVPYPVEINPRYPASVEVLEYGTGTPALALHCKAFAFEELCKSQIANRKSQIADQPIVGKAILFAWMSLIFPADGPWMDTLRQPGDVWEMPAFADIPHAGQCIEAGRPILTIFASATSPSECREKLWQIAADLENRLFAASRRA